MRHLILPLVMASNDGGHAGQKIILLLFALHAVVQQTLDAGDALHQCSLGALGDLVTHEDADLIQLLPFAVQRQQGANLEIASGDVKTR
jgi:hypothetical protein